MNDEPLSLTALKQFLKQRTKEELINDIGELFTRFDAVKDFYQVQLGPAEDAQVIAKYKKIIKQEIFPSRGLPSLKYSVARKAVSDYKKVCRNPANIAELMIFYVEQGVKCTNEYGDIDEPFYNSMESMFAAAVKHIVKYDLKDQFEEPCRRIVEQTSHCGWGFHDTLSDIYNEAFP